MLRSDAGARNVDMLQSFGGDWPDVHEEAFVHPAATVIGRVRLGARTTVWPSVSLRGDVGPITIGEDTSIQDGTVGHSTTGISELVVGSRVTVGHLVILHGCQIADDCLIGMGSIVMDNAVIPQWTIVGAGSLIPPNKKYPLGMLLIGRPAVPVRPITDAERATLGDSFRGYVELGRIHRTEKTR